jgi:hypothetical protein
MSSLSIRNGSREWLMFVAKQPDSHAPHFGRPAVSSKKLGAAAHRNDETDIVANRLLPSYQADHGGRMIARERRLAGSECAGPAAGTY